ncbi:hypothetical protein JAAARDRAFT_188285 [Jaapia argillacea MUCL 33604]|uniref:18S rRNA factor 2 n=1 Tax=Jaapia argillacea MUCL 33604 TaxID=933084 RepID=A0A067QNA0_9AGAM|nr:hypothetical protein JAAARDRAFT_188285 [Jaapia argillacea MUCL 33604]
MKDPRFNLDQEFFGEDHAESSKSVAGTAKTQDTTGSDIEEHSHEADHDDGIVPGMDPQGFDGPSEKVVTPLTPEALAAFKAAQDKAGVIYISRIPPGMQPRKVRHLMSQHGEVGRVYLQQEDAKRAYLRRKYTTTKKPHFTEGWIEFKDKRVARTIAEMLNAEPIGGKKGNRWRDDVWTMKYLPKFKWNMLTEQIAHEAALHTARLRVELSQSKSEQRDYLKNVELARVLDKRAERKRKAGDEETEESDQIPKPRRKEMEKEKGLDHHQKKKKKVEDGDGIDNRQLGSVLGSIF